MKTRYLIAFIAVCAAAVLGPKAQANTLQVGPGKQYATPCAAIAAAASGDEIDIDTSGNYTGDVCQWDTDGLTLVGVGGGRAVINAGGKNSQGKAIWVISGNNTTVENIEFTGATVADMNGAGIRAEGNNLTIRNCYFHDNQEGILTDGGNSTILIEFSEFYHNGAGDGFSHNLYIGNITHFIFRYNYSHGAVIGHLLKSRAAENEIYYNRLTDESTGTASYEIDLPNGGMSFIIGNLIEKGPQGQNNALVSYQEEGAASGNPDHELFVVNNTMVNDYGQGVFVVVDSSVQVPALIQNNIFQGSGTVTTQASASQVSNFAGNASLVSPTTYDYHLQAGSAAINKGSTPGQGAGVSLTPVWQYVHPLCAEARAISGSAIDIGAYEFNGGNGVPPPNAPSGCGSSSSPAPSASLSPTTLSFGNQVLHTTSASQKITVTNGGTASLTISSISASGDFAQTNTCGASLAAGASCAVNVTFTPTALNARTGTVSITDNASGSPQTASLSGTGVAAASPTANLAPTSLSFGSQAVGTSSAGQIATLTNTGTATLNISSVTTSGDYSQTNNCGSSLTAGASCTINVTFSPSTPGSRPGTVSVADNASGSPQAVTLTGAGVTSAPSVGLNPPTLSYTGQLIGVASASQALTLSNSGNAALNITGITASGDFSQTNNCGNSLKAGGTCNINIAFKPTAGGSRTGQLSVADNASGAPQTVTLAGTGMDFSLAVSPSSATVNAGKSATVNLAIMPVGGLNEAVSVSCTGAPAGASCNVGSSTVTLNGTSQSSTSVTVTTSAASLLPTKIREFHPQLLLLLIMAVALFMATSMLVSKNARFRRLGLVQCFATMLLVAPLVNGCAGFVKGTSSPSGGTPVGSFVLTITGTVSGVSHSTTFSLNVE